MVESDFGLDLMDVMEDFQAFLHFGLFHCFCEHLKGRKKVQPEFR